MIRPSAAVIRAPLARGLHFYALAATSFPSSEEKQKKQGWKGGWSSCDEPSGSALQGGSYPPSLTARISQEAAGWISAKSAKRQIKDVPLQRSIKQKCTEPGRQIAQAQAVVTIRGIIHLAFSYQNCLERKTCVRIEAKYAFSNRMEDCQHAVV